MVKQLVNGEAAKALVAILTAVAAALPIYFTDAPWLPVVIMAIGAITTYLVPNQPPAGQGKDQPARM